MDSMFGRYESLNAAAAGPLCWRQILARPSASPLPFEPYYRECMNGAPDAASTHRGESRGATRADERLFAHAWGEDGDAILSWFEEGETLCESVMLELAMVEIDAEERREERPSGFFRSLAVATGLLPAY